MHQYGSLIVGHSPAPPYPDRVLLLRATTSFFHVPDRGWGGLLGDALDIVDIECSHEDLSREATGPLVGPLLTRALNQQQLATA